MQPFSMDTLQKPIFMFALGMLSVYSAHTIGSQLPLVLNDAQAATVVLALADDYGTNGTAPTQKHFCPHLGSTVQKGDRSQQVGELQAFLTDYYDLDENILTGGYFGKLTQQYVSKFQSEQGLPSLGIAGQLTRAKIFELCGKKDDVLNSSTLPLTQKSADTKLRTSTTTPQASPRCTITSSKSAVVSGEQFVLNWTTNNIPDPVMYQQVKAGGTVAIAPSGSMVWTAEPNKDTVSYNDVFEIGAGGIDARYKPICGVSVTIKPQPVATSPTATIDSATLTQISGSSFVLSGSVAAVQRLAVYIVPSTYTGNVDMQSLGNLEKGGGTTDVTSNYAYISSSRWSLTFGGLSSQSYKVFVFDISSCTTSACGATPLLTTGILTIGSATTTSMYQLGTQSLTASAALAGAAFMAPFGLAIDSLTEIFVTLGVGQ